MDRNERNEGQHPLVTTLDPNDPGERFYGYQVTRRMVKPPEIPVHPGPDFSGRAPARYQEIAEALSSPHPTNGTGRTLSRFRGGVFFVTDHGIFTEGEKDGQRPRRTNKGDTRKTNR